MRSIVTAALLWTLGSLALPADTAAFVSQMYDRFTQSCSVAFTDPQAYVNSVPPQNARGAPNVVVSPDGKVVISHHAKSGFAEEVTFARHPEHLLDMCIVMPHPDHPEFQRSIQIMSQVNGLSLYSEQLAEAVKSTLPTKLGIIIVGGRTPIDDTHDYYAQGDEQRNLVQSRHSFSFVLDAGGTRIPSIIAIELGSLSIYSAHTIEVAE